MKEKLSTEPYKGVRDFYPEDKRTLNYIFETMKKVLLSYGYEEYDASPLEPAELYESKGNEEIIRDQTYTFTDRGDRKVTLRPEMTPTVARLVAGKKRELAFPLRWFSIPNVFRYERTQRGRLREHYQLNADLFGIDTIDADIEILAIAHEVMHAFGATPLDFTIHINSRELLNAALEESGLSEEHSKAYIRLMDRKEKMPPEEYEQKKKEILGSAEDPETILTTLSAPKVKAAKEKLDQMISALKERSVTNVVHDLTITRGFDYYTGMVFEVFDTNAINNRSLFGGGRYDNLTALFSEEAVTGVGFGMGDVTLRDFLETHELLPKLRAETHLYVGTLSQDFTSEARRLQEIGRKHNLNIAINLSEKKVGDQIKIADKKGIPFFVAIGENEVKENRYSLKNLTTGDEDILTAEEIAPFIKDTLSVAL